MSGSRRGTPTSGGKRSGLGLPGSWSVAGRAGGSAGRDLSAAVAGTAIGALPTAPQLPSGACAPGSGLSCGVGGQMSGLRPGMCCGGRSGPRARAPPTARAAVVVAKRRPAATAAPAATRLLRSQRQVGRSKQPAQWGEAEARGLHCRLGWPTAAPAGQSHDHGCWAGRAQGSVDRRPRPVVLGLAPRQLCWPA